MENNCDNNLTVLLFNMINFNSLYTIPPTNNKKLAPIIIKLNITNILLGKVIDNDPDKHCDC